MSNTKTLQEEAYEANRKLPELGLVQFTFGNVSAADHQQGLFAIKPSGVPYAELSPSAMVVVDFDGKPVSGKLRPSSDSLTHAVLYRHWPAVTGITHTHSTYATAWAQAQRDIPIYGTTHADHNTCAIPCAAPMSDDMIAGNYEYETGFQILNCLKNRQLTFTEVEMMLVACHGPFAWGASAAKSVYHAAVLEEIARLAFLTEQINPQASPLKPALIKKHFERKHGPDSYYGQ